MAKNGDFEHFANKRHYGGEDTKNLLVYFNVHDPKQREMLEYLDSKKVGKSTYVKRLIYEDMMKAKAVES